MSVQQDTLVRAPSGPTTVIRASSGFAAINLADLWRYRDLLLAFALRDIKLRYRQTALGVAWVVLQPLIGAAIFAMFSRVAKIPTSAVEPMAFSFASLLGWTLFQSTLTKSGNCLLGNSQLVAKVFFPRLVLPLSVLLGVLLDFAISLVILFVLLIVFHIALTPAILLLPLFVAGLLMLAVGVGMYLAALSVSYRDIQFIVPVLVQFLFWASPVVLPASLFQGKLAWVMLVNPLAGFIEGIRWVLLGTAAPAAGMVAYSFGAAVLVFLAAALAFRRMERRFADVI